MNLMGFTSLTRACHSGSVPSDAGKEPLMWSQSCRPLYQFPGQASVFCGSTSMSAVAPARLALRANLEAAAG